MGSDVNLKAAGPRVGFRTVGALVGQLSGVNEFMGLQVTSGDELLAAVSLQADVRPLTRLSANISNSAFD